MEKPMAQPFDTAPYYAKLARNESLTEDEIVALLKAVNGYQAATAYLASCEAATLEYLPASTSKSERSRHVAICEKAVEMLDGDFHSVPHRTTAASAQERCRRAAADCAQPPAKRSRKVVAA